MTELDVYHTLPTTYDASQSSLSFARQTNVPSTWKRTTYVLKRMMILRISVQDQSLQAGQT